MSIPEFLRRGPAYGPRNDNPVIRKERESDMATGRSLSSVSVPQSSLVDHPAVHAAVAAYNDVFATNEQQQARIVQLESKYREDVGRLKMDLEVANKHIESLGRMLELERRDARHDVAVLQAKIEGLQRTRDIMLVRMATITTQILAMTDEMKHAEQMVREPEREAEDEPAPRNLDDAADAAIMRQLSAVIERP